MPTSRPRKPLGRAKRKPGPKPKNPSAKRDDANVINAPDQKKPAPESNVSTTSASLAVTATANQVMSEKTVPPTSESLACAPVVSFDVKMNVAEHSIQDTPAPTARPMLENSNKKSAIEVAVDPAQQFSFLALRGRKMMLRW